MKYPLYQGTVIYLLPPSLYFFLNSLIFFLALFFIFTEPTPQSLYYWTLTLIRYSRKNYHFQLCWVFCQHFKVTITYLSSRWLLADWGYSSIVEHWPTMCKALVHPQQKSEKERDRKTKIETERKITVCFHWISKNLFHRNKPSILYYSSDKVIVKYLQ
jgi:hypothetical protein